jgi:hypothetical protein
LASTDHPRIAGLEDRASPVSIAATIDLTGEPFMPRRSPQFCAATAHVDGAPKPHALEKPGPKNRYGAECKALRADPFHPLDGQRETRPNKRK